MARRKSIPLKKLEALGMSPLQESKYFNARNMTKKRGKRMKIKKECPSTCIDHSKSNRGKKKGVWTHDTQSRNLF